MIAIDPVAFFLLGIIAIAVTVTVVALQLSKRGGEA